MREKIVELLSRPRMAWYGIAALSLFTLLATTRASYDVFIFNSCLMAAIGAIALNVLMGTSGQVSIGAAAFLAVGAFSTVFFGRMGVPMPIDILGGAFVSAAAGLVCGLPALRLRGLYLALSTMAAHFIVMFLVREYQSAAVGAAPFMVDRLFRSPDLDQFQRSWAWLLVVVVSIEILIVTRLVRERTGRRIRMVREHESVAAALGINVTRTKLTVFVLSSAVLGAAGGLNVYFIGTLSVDNFTFQLAILYLAIVVIGGMDSVAGAVLGAFVVTALPFQAPRIVDLFMSSSEASVRGPQIARIVYGVLLIVLMVGSRNGLVGFIRQLWQMVLRLGSRMATKVPEVNTAVERSVR